MAGNGSVKVVGVGSGDVNRRYLCLNAFALSLVLASAFAVILSTHTCREAYAKLQVLEASQWYLQEDHGRLVLEHSTWASHYRVEQVATRDLGMRAPEAGSQRVVLQ
ncbi:MAG: cell division protein FtsL [Halioglobus sp.]|jgi:cell division protein FtsL